MSRIAGSLPSLRVRYPECKVVQTPNLHVFGVIFQSCSYYSLCSHVLQQRPIGEIPVSEMEVDGT
jgi:hypothetical protein